MSGPDSMIRVAFLSGGLSLGGRDGLEFDSARNALLVSKCAFNAV